MNYFVICTDSAKGTGSGASAEQRNVLTDYLKALGLQVWHWFEDVWLVVDDEGGYSAKDLRDGIRPLIGMNNNVLVMQVSPISFSGFGPKDGWPWMNQRFGRSL